MTIFNMQLAQLFGFFVVILNTAGIYGISIQAVTQHVLAPQADLEGSERMATDHKPFYIISHRTLTARGVIAAIEDGANAMEIDARSYDGGWRADHDGFFGSAGDEMQVMFEAIVAQRRAGKVVNFVWLDIKNPDRCSPDTKRYCSILALRDMARNLLEPVGVRVLYGISKEGPTIQTLGRSLNSNEALGLDCEAGNVYQLFEGLQPLEKSKMVYSCGYASLSLDYFGRKEQVLAALGSAKFGRTFAWTVMPWDKGFIELLGNAGVDGLIYGATPANAYGESSFLGGGNQRKKERETQGKVADWVRRNPERCYIPKQEDSPW